MSNLPELLFDETKEPSVILALISILKTYYRGCIYLYSKNRALLLIIFFLLKFARYATSLAIFRFIRQAFRSLPKKSINLIPARFHRQLFSDDLAIALRIHWANYTEDGFSLGSILLYWIFYPSVVYSVLDSIPHPELIEYI